jgi:hypothetical protein
VLPHDRPKITANARILFNTLPPTDAVSVDQTLDARAPTTTVTAQQLDGSNDYQVTWEATDDAGGSGVRHVTVYVAEDGGDFKIWLSQTTDTTGVFSGQAGHTYEFIALATDNAGNRERPPLGASAPDDGTQVNLGELSTVPTTVDTTQPPAPAPQPATNPLFVAAEQGVPAVQPLTDQPEFDSILAPFSAQAFATGFTQSGGDVGALAVLELSNGEVLVSGGGNRGWIYRFSEDGGRADTAWAELDEPVFNLPVTTRLSDDRGGALLLLDNVSGVLGRFGDGITQAVAVHPTTGLLYVSSGDGIEIFDPATRTFTHFSNVRVDDLQFSPAGELWGTSWPDRGTVLRFDAQGRATPMVHFDAKVDSIALAATARRKDCLRLHRPAGWAEQWLDAGDGGPRHASPGDACPGGLTRRSAESDVGWPRPHRAVASGGCRQPPDRAAGFGFHSRQRFAGRAPGPADQRDLRSRHVHG